MARGDLQVQNFVKGLHTESSPINFPAGASIDETNFVLRRDGTRDKRLGLDMEQSGLMQPTGLTEGILAAARVQHYRWSTPNGNPNIDIGVVQIGSKLFFINLYADAVSSTILNGANGVVIGTRNDALMSFATINNYLVMVSNGSNDPVLFSYDQNTDTITTETAPIMVRDVWGVDDGTTVDVRPVTLSDAHKYNLRNQGWTEGITSTCGTDAIDCTFSTLGVYPSNSDHWSSGRIEDLTDPNVFKYDPSLYEKVSINTGQQARGHYIIPLYSRGAGRFSNTGLTLPTDAEQGRITTIASHQGRLFYSGILSSINTGDIRSPNLSGAVLFSQTFTNKEDLVKCYTEADPTNIEINDIIDTDGGIINIPDASLILKLHASSAGLYVFAVNGVWIITSDDQGFRATSYRIRKVSNFGLLAKHSVIEAGGTLIYWAEGGIYSIAPQNDAGGTTYNVNNITESTIQRMYNSYPDVFKRNVRGFYDAPANKARWLLYSPSTRVEGDPIEGEYIPNLVPATVPGETSVISLGGTHPTVLRIDDDRFFLIYRHPATTNLRGVVCTVNQTTLAVSVGTPTMIFSTESYPDFTGLVMNLVDTDKIILIHRAASNIFTGVIITVSGTSFSVGSTQSIITEPSSVIYPTLSRMSATKYIMQYNYDSGGNRAAALVLDISGNTITPGSIVRPGYVLAAYLKHVTDSTALAVTSEGSDTLMVVSSDGTTVSYNETGKFVTANPVFQAGGVALYMYDNYQGNNVFVISARSLYEAPSRIMMRVLEVNGTIISSHDTSEFIETNITDNSPNNRSNIPIVMTSSILAHTYITGTGDMTLRTYNYSVTEINARTSKLTVDAGSFLTLPSAVKLNDEVFIWAANSSTGDFKMQAVRVS
jgi:hypothetical protein